MISTRNIDPNLGIEASRIRGLANFDVFGSTLYVDANHANATDTNNPGTVRTTPLATLARAVALADAGDTICVASGHTETISTATALDISKRVYVVGMGSGKTRPTFTLASVVGATVTISGDGAVVENLAFTTSVDSLANAITISGDDVVLRNCYIVEGASTQILNGVTVSATADDVVIDGLVVYMPTAGPASAISIAGNTNLRTVIQNCWIMGDFSTACIIDVAATTQVLIRDNYLESLNAADACIALQATSSGSIGRNLCRIATDAQTTWIAAADCQWYENYGVNLDGETGVLIGTPSA